MRESNYWERWLRQRAGRRQVVRGTGLAMVGATAWAAVGCGGDDDEQSGSTPGASSTSTSPSATSAAQPKRGGQIIARRPSLITYGDPLRNTSGYDPTVTHLYAAPLITTVDTPKGKELAPSLVSEWSQPDENTLTLKLRQDVKFTDGTPVNAAAIKYAFDRERSGSTLKQALLKGVTVETPDEYTANVKFDRPNPVFFEALAMNSPSGMGAIVSPTAYETLGEDKFDKSPVSAGPFKIQSFVRDGDSVFVRNEDWPITAPNGDKLPYLDQITIRVLPDSAVAFAALQSGGIDLDWVFLGENVPQLRSNPKFDVLLNKGAITTKIQFLLNKNPTDIAAFRKGIAYALDRDEIAETFTDGLGEAAHGPLSPLSPYFDESQPHYTYDTNKAKEMLAQAGLADGSEINMACFASGVYSRMAEMIQAQLRKVNMKVTVQPLEVPVLTEKRTTAELSTVLTAGGGPQLDPLSYFTTYYSSLGQMNGAKLPEMDALLDKATGTFKSEERAALFSQMMKLDFDNSYMGWVQEAPTICGYDKSVQGIRWLHTGSAMDLTQAWRA